MDIKSETLLLQSMLSLIGMDTQKCLLFLQQGSTLYFFPSVCSTTLQEYITKGLANEKFHSYVFDSDFTI